MTTDLPQSDLPAMKPYLIRAMLDWCRDTGSSPYLMVAVDDRCRVPEAFVDNGHIVFDISDDATNKLVVDESGVSFQARFGENNEIFDVFAPTNRIHGMTPLEHQEYAMMWEVTPSVESSESALGTKDEPSQKVTMRRPMRIK